MTYNYNIELLTESIKLNELNMVKYDGMAKIIIFELAFKLDDGDKHLAFIQEFEKGLNLYFRLTSIKPELVHIETKTEKDLGFISLHRDLNTVEIGELTLFTNLAHLFLGYSLIKDNYSGMVNKKHIKENILSQVDKELKNSYLVYRHKGKVIVHNR